MNIFFSSSHGERFLREIISEKFNEKVQNCIKIHFCTCGEDRLSNLPALNTFYFLFFNYFDLINAKFNTKPIFHFF